MVFEVIAHNWFCSYLSNHFQCTKYMNATSDLSKISCGIPQRSLFGPLLFIMYIYQSSHCFSFILYADDTNILCCNKDVPSLFNNANTHLSYVCNWFKANRLLLNLKKCNYMYMISCNRNKKCAIHNLNILISNQQILKVDFIDSHLTWKPNINKTCKKVSKSIGIISRRKPVFPDKVLRTLYCSLILPYLSL